ncbi:MAG: tRNA epoxyqueuosine(34) reductase QueG [Bacteroidales bacterium]|nr:tRNA epoxyqueuosine(34) reductase QueG [Bacteroidales bacterium]
MKQNLSLDSSEDITLKIKEKALSLGFDDCGVAEAGEVPARESGRLTRWVDSGFHADMGYMERNNDKRIDPRSLVLGARSVIVLLTNYYSGYNPDSERPRVARYAAGADYHKVLKDKMYSLLQFIKEIVPGSNGRVFTDSAPVMERTWAVTAGLGWIGRNSMLISKKYGSYNFLAEIITTAELNPDRPFKTSHCGSCTKCVTACPTAAILPDLTVDSNRCISWVTIENKDKIPGVFKGRMQNWIFGCDICIEVCPWNNHPVITGEKLFRPNDAVERMANGNWQLTDQKQFEEDFSDSPLLRTGYNGIRRNLEFIKDDPPSVLKGNDKKQ